MFFLVSRLMHARRRRWPTCQIRPSSSHYVVRTRALLLNGQACFLKREEGLTEEMICSMFHLRSAEEQGQGSKDGAPVQVHSAIAKALLFFRMRVTLPFLLRTVQRERGWKRFRVSWSHNKADVSKLLLQSMQHAFYKFARFASSLDTCSWNRRALVSHSEPLPSQERTGSTATTAAALLLLLLPGGGGEGEFSARAPPSRGGEIQ